MVSQEQKHKDIENLDLFVAYYKDKTHEEYSVDSITDCLFCYRKLRADSQRPRWENRTERQWKERNRSWTAVLRPGKESLGVQEVAWHSLK